MGRIDRVEAQAWASLVTLVAIYCWFQSQMVESWQIVDHAPSALFGIYIVVLALLALTEIVISAVGAGLDGKRRIERDERDYWIDARANQNERLFIIIGVNALVWQLLWEGILPEHGPALLNVTTAPAIFFWLFAILFGGEIVKRASTVFLYRLQAARS